MLPRVRTVTANDDYTLTVTFTSGEVKTYDCRPLLDFGVFTALRDPTTFKRVHASRGTVEWPGEIDICPDTVYLDSRPVGRE
jgi:hypothetical protein